MPDTGIRRAGLLLYRTAPLLVLTRAAWCYQTGTSVLYASRLVCPEGVRMLAPLTQVSETPSERNLRPISEITCREAPPFEYHAAKSVTHCTSTARVNTFPAPHPQPSTLNPKPETRNPNPKPHTSNKQRKHLVQDLEQNPGLIVGGVRAASRIVHRMSIDVGRISGIEIETHHAHAESHVHKHTTHTHTNLRVDVGRIDVGRDAAQHQHARRDRTTPHALSEIGQHTHC
eukprot:1802313-Rhodomonas_salina.3